MATQEAKNSAAWIRAEHKAVTTLIDKVKPMVAMSPTTYRGDWLLGLRRDFGRLRAHLKQHMAAEESEGFMRPVLELRPTLSPEVDRLKKEHSEMLSWLDLIWAELEMIKPDDKLLVQDVCLRIQNLIAAVERHKEHEELLVTFVFSQDIGTAD